MFKNLSIGTKLLVGFVAIAIISAGVGSVGVIKIGHIAEDDAAMYRGVTVPLADLANMSTYFQRLLGEPHVRARAVASPEFTEEACEGGEGKPLAAERVREGGNLNFALAASIRYTAGAYRS
ncbi:Methyl-accepting chemotaxis sensor/transducer protein [Citrifermentans bremense]|uniref:Methyl-accepting chemotaxis sensor/transducer protein n=1 Tax=Citrifermentans bremense TaxID=60035 RepID=A0A6S6M4V7_9BACT|nr:MCP four helix bundle domain-containing protein [Citrifermentans bremense]BCG48723.1 Methyl-accepting chemotaxis sensor/transducer protein [Citrifermentans bremense]